MSRDTTTGTPPTHPTSTTPMTTTTVPFTTSVPTTTPGPTGNFKSFQIFCLPILHFSVLIFRIFCFSIAWKLAFCPKCPCHLPLILLIFYAPFVGSPTPTPETVSTTTEFVPTTTTAPLTTTTPEVGYHLLLFNLRIAGSLESPN